MIAVDEDALICDFAETYNIYNYRQFPAVYVGILANGLRNNSRIKLRLSETKIDTNTQLLAAIFDEVAILRWGQTVDGHKGRNKPKSLLSQMLENSNEEKEIESFNSIEEFEYERKRIIEEKYGN